MYQFQSNQSIKSKTNEVIAPFRESKLTRLFQQALSGKEKIVLVVNINPGPSLYVETHNVLKLSAIASKIVMETTKVVAPKMCNSRFSRAVVQSMTTATNWEHTVDEVEGNLFIHLFKFHNRHKA